MPTADKHRIQYEHNKSFFKTIEVIDGYYDWKVTVIFYTAIHYLEMMLNECHNNMMLNTKLIHGFTGEPGSHKDRQDMLLKTNEFEGDYMTAYSSLSEQCWKARYKCFKTSKTDVDKAFKRLEIIESISSLTLKGA